MAKFGLDEQFRTSQLTCWQRVRPKIWLLFEEPNSTAAAKVQSLSLSLPLYSNMLTIIDALSARHFKGSPLRKLATV